MKIKIGLKRIALISVSITMLLSIGTPAVNASHFQRHERTHIIDGFKQAKETAAEKRTDKRYHIGTRERHSRNHIQQLMRYNRRHVHTKYILRNNKSHQLTKSQLVQQIYNFDMYQVNRKLNNAKKRINYRHQSRNFKLGFIDGALAMLTKHLIRNRAYHRGYIESTALSVNPHNRLTKHALRESEEAYKFIEKTRDTMSQSVPVQAYYDAYNDVYNMSTTIK